MATKQNISKGKSVPAKKPVKPSASPSLASIERVRWQRKLSERLAIIAVLLFFTGVGVAAWLTEGRLFSSTMTALRSLEGSDGQGSENASVNCKHPKNKNTPYCQERTAEVEGRWQSMSRVQGGKAAPFKLSGSGK